MGNVESDTLASIQNVSVCFFAILMFFAYVYLYLCYFCVYAFRRNHTLLKLYKGKRLAVTIYFLYFLKCHYDRRGDGRGASGCVQTQSNAKSKYPLCM